MLKESERDMYDQRNQQLNNMVLSSTVMLAVMTTLLIEGTMPAASAEYTIITFAVCCGLAFSVFTICVVLCTYE